MKRIRMWPIAALIALIAIASLGGCGNGAGNAAETSSPTADRGGVLHVAFTEDPETLAPASTLQESAGQISSQINETLFRVNASGKLIPQLANSFRMSDDGMTYTIGIKSGITFSNGEPLTAQDVVFSLDQARHSIYYATLYEPIRLVEATSPTTVVIKTQKPVAALKADLSLVYSAIVPKNYGGVSEKEFAQHPIGTGPFEFKRWVQGESVTLVKNPHYWRPDQPLLDSIVFETVPEDNSRLSLLRAGSTDAEINPPTAQLESVEAMPGLKVAAGELARVDLLLLNVNKPLFSDPRIREALNIAVDREGINKAVLKGRGAPGGAFLGPNLAPYADRGIKPPVRDIGRAKQLVREATSELKIDPSFTLITLSGETYYSSASQILQQDFDEAGFEVKLETLDFSAAQAKVESGEFDAEMNGYYSISPDPSENVTYYLGSMAERSGAETKEFARLASAAASSMDPVARRKLYFELQELVAKQKESVILDYQRNFWAMKDSVTGFEINPQNFFWLAKAGFSS